MKKPMKCEISDETIGRIKWLSQRSGLSEETIITTALILGTIKLKEWTKEDE